MMHPNQSIREALEAIKKSYFDDGIEREIDQFKLLTVYGLSVQDMNQDTPLSNIAAQSGQEGGTCTITFTIKQTFKDVVKSFRTSGAMSDSLLNMVSFSSVDELRAA